MFKERLTVPLVAALALLSIGAITGRAGRPAPPPLIIERAANSPLYNSPGDSARDGNHPSTASAESPTLNPARNSQPASDDESVYICGARTKKGTPCARRVHSPVRCWQHKGTPAMLPPEKLALRE